MCAEFPASTAAACFPSIRGEIGSSTLDFFIGDKRVTGKCLGGYNRSPDERNDGREKQQLRLRESGELERDSRVNSTCQ